MSTLARVAARVTPSFSMPDAQPQDLAFPDEAFRAAQPPAGEPRPFRLPAMQTFTLANGIAVYLVEQHALPLVSLDLSFPGGAALDPVGKEGLASVCMAMLTEGTEALDKLAYAERLADTASSIGGYAGDDSVGLTLSSLTKHLVPAFAQLVETLRSPGFRASDFERMVKRRIEGVKQARRSPGSVAARVGSPVLYGADHPFGAVTTEASLAALTLDDCKAFAQRRLGGSHARLFVVGDLTEPQIRALFDAPALAGWSQVAAPVPALPAPRTMPGRIFFVDIPGATQSSVSYLQLGPQRTSPGFFANAMLGAIVGGGFTSRLNMNLREDKGYSYGARGSFSYTRLIGAFTASATVAGNATYQTIREIDRELRGLATHQPGFAVTADELEREQRGAILGLPGRFATAQAALGQYRALVYFGLPLAYYESYVDLVASVTAADVMASAARELSPDRAVYVVVGDGAQPMILRDGDHDVPYMNHGAPVGLRDALAELAARGDVGPGALVELDADGRVVVG
ncbi:MAG: pitrilysin family protein [Kofleriaceae bacterium]